MFTGFMVDTWIVASLVAVVAGLVGFFVVLAATPSPRTPSRKAPSPAQQPPT